MGLLTFAQPLNDIPRRLEILTQSRVARLYPCCYARATCLIKIRADGKVQSWLWGFAVDYKCRHLMSVTSNDGSRMDLNFQPYQNNFNWGVLIVWIIAEERILAPESRSGSRRHPIPPYKNPFEITILHLAIRGRMFDWSMQWSSGDREQRPTTHWRDRTQIGEVDEKNARHNRNLIFV